MAMTTKYCSVTGAGAKNGTDAANAWDWAAMLSNVSAGDDVLIQEGTYSLTGSSSFTNSGTATSPIRLRGAKTDWTPLAPTRTNAGALSTTNMPLVSFSDAYRITLSTWMILFGVKIVSPAGSTGVVEMSANSMVSRCVIENSSTDSSGKVVVGAVSAIIFDNDISHTGASGGGSCVTTSTNCKIADNRISGGATTTVGVVSTSAGVSITGNVIFTKGHGITSGDQSVFIRGNTIVLLAGSTSDGIQITAGSTLPFVLDNLVTDCTQYGLNGVAASRGFVSARNRIDRCTSGAYNSATDWLASTKFGDDVTSATQANEYENAGSGDFRLKSTSPAIGKGPWLLGDIGALQAAAAAAVASGGVPVFGGKVSRRA